MIQIYICPMLAILFTPAIMQFRICLVMFMIMPKCAMNKMYQFVKMCIRFRGKAHTIISLQTRHFLDRQFHPDLLKVMFRWKDFIPRRTTILLRPFNFIEIEYMNKPDLA